MSRLHSLRASIDDVARSFDADPGELFSIPPDVTEGEQGVVMFEAGGRRRLRMMRWGFPRRIRDARKVGIEADIIGLVADLTNPMWEQNRRTVLSASMMGVRGQVQREGDVIHVIARRLDDMSALLASVGGRSDVADVYRVSRADVVKYGMGPDPRDPAERHLGKGPRDIFIPDLRLGSGIVPGEPVEGIKVKTRDFR